MKTILHKANTRGHADYGWLNTYHTFSFANYYDPERVSFGVLRVLNDDVVQGGEGFGNHVHDNMEVISIPLEGTLLHKDSMENTQVIKYGDVQVMSAGTGIYHSEHNASNDKPVKFLQIWIFPDKRDVEPRYEITTLNIEKHHNKLHQFISPRPINNELWIHQDAWFNIGIFDKGQQIEYTIQRNGNGLYAFVIKGSFTVNDEQLDARDGWGVWDIDKVTFTAESNNAEILLIDVPME